MSLLTRLALSRRPVTVLVIILVLVGGVLTFSNLRRELFPEIEFPNILVITSYPSANPEAVERDVSEPIENAISGIAGLKEIESTSSENRSIVIATFEFGEDMEEAERTIESNVGSIRFPDGVEDSIVTRISTDTFPVLQLSVIGKRDVPSLQRIVDDLILPSIERVDGVFRVDVAGNIDEQVIVTVDSERLKDFGLSLIRVSSAISDNNLSIPAGSIDQRGLSFFVRTANEYGSLNEIRELVVGFEGGVPSGRPVLLSEVADVALGTDDATTISRTNGKPSLGIIVIKSPDANTVEVTQEIGERLQAIKAILPEDVEIITIFDNGPEITKQLTTVQREGLLGFLFAVLVVFVFLLNLRPTILKGIVFTLRPTIVIGFTIPLSILSAVLMMGAVDLSLNFMSLAGLAIAVGRVVDDSIVVLENMYRHIQRGEDRFEAAYTATSEVAGAIVSSTLTTIVVFVPLAFIQGLVGEFFTPFTIAVSFSLIGSTIVALTAVPVLGAILLRRGDFPEVDQEGASGPSDTPDTLMQRIYTPILLWALSHRWQTISASLLATAASLGLVFIIPITFFPSGEPEFLTVTVELPSGTGVRRTFQEVLAIEKGLAELEEEGIVKFYQTTIGSTGDIFGPGGSGGINGASIILALEEDPPEGITERIRSMFPGGDDVDISVVEVTGGPPSEGLELTVTGGNFSDIKAASRDVEEAVKQIEGLVNVTSNVSAARDEVVIDVNPEEAAKFGLTTASVGLQINQYIVGRTISEVDLEGVTMDIVIKGDPEDVDEIDKLKSLTIEGPLGTVALGAISNIVVVKGPVSISRFDNERSVTITGEIRATDTRAVGAEVARVIESVELPPGVQVRSGGIFQQITEGFQDVFTAMALGIVLVYLVMVASLGSLRNPFVIVMSLPLAVVGALLALVITGRTLSLSSLMGFLLLIGVVVTNAIVLITFVQQLREQGMGVYEALVEGARVRLRPILMTAFTTTFALLPLAVSTASEGGIIGADMATVVIGGLFSSTVLTLVYVPVVYIVMHESLPAFFGSVGDALRRLVSSKPPLTGQQPGGDD